MPESLCFVNSICVLKFEGGVVFTCIKIKVKHLVFPNFKVLVEKESKIDNGGEISKEFNTYKVKNRIKQKLIAGYTPQENNIA